MAMAILHDYEEGEMGDTTRTSLHTLVVDHHKNEADNFSFFLITLTLFLTPTIFRHTCSFLFVAACICLLVTTTSAVHTSAGGAALAVTFSLSSLNVHDNNGADKAAYQQRGKKKITINQGQK